MCEVFPLYDSLPIILSKHAQSEMDGLGLSLWDVATVLEHGFDCQKGRRKENMLEKCKGSLKVVVAKIDWSEKEYWRLIHVSKTNR